MKGCKRPVYPLQWISLMMMCCGIAVKMLGILGVSVRKMKALMEIVTLIGKGG